VATETLDQARERLRPFVEKAKTFSGWGFELETRLLGPDHPWDYSVRARELMTRAESVLDLGTGGGERFGRLLAGYSGRSVATEEWVVNAPIAANRLRPFGTEVIWCSSLDLPFVAESFELVIDRHEALAPEEVVRVLKPRGTVLTQQMWGETDEIRRFFPRLTDFGDFFHGYQDGFRAGGMEILDARTHEVPMAYAGLGDLVFLFCISPWDIPDFDPLGSDLEALLALERAYTTSDGLVLYDGRCIIEARKPA
jgi:hypothetical protein